MATTEDLYVLRTQGEDELKRLEVQIEKTRSALSNTIVTQGAASQAAITQARSLAQLEGQYKDLGASVSALHARTSGGIFSPNVALGINQVAQGIEDLQYSVGGAMNNLGAAAMMFGAGGLWVTGLTLAGVAVTQFSRHWDELEKLWKNTSATGAITAVEKLGNVSLQYGERLAASTREQVAQQRGQAIIGELTPEEKLQQTAVQAAFQGQAGGFQGQPIDRNKLAQALAQQAGTPYTTEELQQRKNAQANITTLQASDVPFITRQITGSEESNQKVLRDTENAARRRAEDEARTRIAAAETDPMALQHLMDEMRKAGGQTAVFAEQLEKANEAGRAEAEQNAELERLRQIEIEQSNKLAQSRHDALIENLNIQGQTNEAGDARTIRLAEQENARREARRQGRLTRFVSGYGGQFGNQLGTAMEMANQQGEAPEETDRRLQGQVIARLRSVPERDRLEVASRIVRQTREQRQDQEQQMAMARDVFGPLADPRVRLQAARRGAFGGAGIQAAQFYDRGQRMARQQAGRMEAMRRQNINQQRRLLRRFGVDIPDMEGRTGVPQMNRTAITDDPAKKQMDAADKIAGAADKMEKALEDARIIL